MTPLEVIVKKFEEASPLTAKKLRRNLAQFDDRHHGFANDFFEKYFRYLDTIGRTADYSVDCYLKMINDMMLLRIQFLETGAYANTTFSEVNNAIYSNPEVMDYHMHGLTLAQFLWPEQYRRFLFFYDHFRDFFPVVNYLEVGGGHGLYVLHAENLLPVTSKIDVVDISESSLRIAKGITGSKKINFVQSDIFEWYPEKKYDFITIGEVIEHLEQPLQMLQRLFGLLNDNGTVFITTPANAPMIDHIYLFRNEQEIRELLQSAGFKIVKELAVFSETLPRDVAVELKLPLMYAAFLKKNI